MRDPFISSSAFSKKVEKSDLNRFQAFLGQYFSIRREAIVDSPERFSRW
jgi:hypothetical protein